MTIKIVTDSTCDLPESVVEELGITVVPLFINIGDKGYLDGVDITRKEFYMDLPAYTSHPTTATPGEAAFTEIFRNLIAEGASQVLSIHIAKSLSATVEVARTAANDFPQQVVVRDSQQLSMGTGFQVEAAARMALEGKSMQEILGALDSIMSRTYVAARLDTLEYLRRSGRMNVFMMRLGSLLQLKPILTMQNGLPESVQVRTEKKAEERLSEMLEERLPIERFALLHTNAAGKAKAFRSRIANLVPESEGHSAADITPVIGAHIGPGAVGFAIISKDTTAGK